MNQKKHSLIIHGLLTLLVLLIYLQGSFEPLELKLIDNRFHWRGPLTPNDRVVIIGITDRSIFELGGWPFSRSQYAELIRKLRGAGARVLGIDLVFDSESTPEEDRLFREGLQVMPTVLPEILVEGTEFINGDLRPMLSVIPPWEGLLSPTQRIGYINARYETVNIDGILRALPLRSRVQERVHQAFSYTAANAWLFEERHANPDVLAFMQNVEPGHFYYINYYNKANEGVEYHPFVNFFNGEVSDEQLKVFRDRIILLGPMAPALGDLHHTPMGTVTGIEVHATVISNILNNEFLIRPGLVLLLPLLLLLALLLGFLLIRNGLRGYLIASAILVFALPLGAYQAFAVGRIIVELVPLLVFFATALLVTGFYWLYMRLIISNLSLVKKVEELKALYEISQTISDIENLEAVLRRVLEIAVNVLRATRGSLMLFNEETGRLVVEVAHISDLTAPVSDIEGPEMPVEPQRAPVALLPGEGVAGVVFEEGRPAIVNQGSRDPRFKSLHLRDLDVDSLLCVPMIMKDRCIGVINVTNRHDQKNFVEADLSLMEIVSRHAATVIENARLYKLATVDGMTGLYVHRYFKIRMREEFMRAQRYRKSISLLMTDVDHFKIFNDTYGHQMGDLVLASVAAVVRDAVRQSDFAARYGGEEFIVILPETDREGAIKLAERVRSRVEKNKIPTARGELSVTVSVGVVTYPDTHAATAEDLISYADAALYTAKNEGRNRSSVYPDTEPEDVQEGE